MSIDVTKSDLAIVLADAEVAALVKNKIIALKTDGIDAALQEEFKNAGFVKDADTLKVSDDNVEVARGATVVIDVTATGDSPVTVRAADENLSTATYADGKLTIKGVNAGATTATVTKGTVNVPVKITVK